MSDSALFASTFFSFPHDCLALTGQTIPAKEGLERFGKKLVSYCWCNKIPQSESFKQLWCIKLKTMGPCGRTPLRSPLVCRSSPSNPLPHSLLSPAWEPTEHSGQRSREANCRSSISLQPSRSNLQRLIRNSAADNLQRPPFPLPWYRVNCRNLILLTSLSNFTPPLSSSRNSLGS